MLKKAGLIVTASAACLLAASPLAFAHDGSDHGSGDNQDSTSLVNGVSGNNTDVPVAVCNNDVQGGLVPVQNIDPNVPAGATAGLLGDTASSQSGSKTDAKSCGQAADSGN